MYWPQSGLRQQIILLLLEAWPRPLTLAEIAESVGGYGKHAVEQALSWLRRRGVVVRVARGLYALSKEYKAHAEILYEKVKKREELYHAHTNSHELTGVSSLTNSLSIEKVKEKVIEIARERYGDLLEPVDYEVLGVLAERALGPGSSYIHDPVGEGLGGALRRLSGSSSYTGWELAESLRRLASLGLVYVRARERKARLDRGLLVEALRAARVSPRAEVFGLKP